MSEDELPVNYRRLEASLQPPSKDVNHERYERAQRSPHDTAAKRLDALVITDPYLLECLKGE